MVLAQVRQTPGGRCGGSGLSAILSGVALAKPEAVQRVHDNNRVRVGEGESGCGAGVMQAGIDPIVIGGLAFRNLAVRRAKSGPVAPFALATRHGRAFFFACPSAPSCRMVAGPAMHAGWPGGP